MTHLQTTQPVWAGTGIAGERAPAHLVSIEMGDPRTPDCSNFGICRVNLWSTEETPPGCGCRISSWINLEAGSLVRLGFVRLTIPPRTYAVHFKKNHLILPADCTVSAGVSGRLLGKPGVLTLQAGVYPVYRCPGILEVYIPYVVE